MKVVPRMHQLRRAYPAVTIMLLLAIWITGAALAQDSETDPVRDQVRDQTRNRTQDGEGEQWRSQIQQRIRNGIDTDPGLTAEQRQTMHENLDACLRLGMAEEDLVALFPTENEPRRYEAQAQLRFQHRVRATAEDGIPAEPLLAKLQEGTTKGASAQALERACARMEEHLRAAHRVMVRAQEGGLEPHGDPAQERRMTREMAQNMWRGLNEEGLDHLREQACQRSRNGQCDLNDLTAASETATRLIEEGLDSERAVQVVGEAIQNGYRAQEMNQFRLMVQARHQQRGPIEGFIEDLEQCLGEGMGAGEMYRYMWQHGWMGPGDMQGPGGQHHIGDVGGGGPGHHGGSGDDDQHGGPQGSPGGDGGSHGGGGQGGGGGGNG